jgi:hypothetical protein
MEHYCQRTLAAVECARVQTLISKIGSTQTSKRTYLADELACMGWRQVSRVQLDVRVAQENRPHPAVRERRPTVLAVQDADRLRHELRRQVCPQRSVPVCELVLLASRTTWQSRCRARHLVSLSRCDRFLSFRASVNYLSPHNAGYRRETQDEDIQQLACSSRPRVAPSRSGAE